jgi:hypothetical protein
MLTNNQQDTKCSRELIIKEEAIPDSTDKGPCKRDQKLELNASKDHELSCQVVI